MSSYFLWGDKEVDDVVLELLEWLLDVFLEEVLHLDLDGVLVVVHVGEVGGVIVLGQGLQLILKIEQKQVSYYYE